MNSEGSSSFADKFLSATCVQEVSKLLWPLPLMHSGSLLNFAQKCKGWPGNSFSRSFRFVRYCQIEQNGSLKIPIGVSADGSFSTVTSASNFCGNMSVSGFASALMLKFCGSGLGNDIGQLHNGDAETSVLMRLIFFFDAL